MKTYLRLDKVIADLPHLLPQLLTLAFRQVSGTISDCCASLERKGQVDKKA